MYINIRFQLKKCIYSYNGKREKKKGLEGDNNNMNSRLAARQIKQAKEDQRTDR